jgi:two-component system cell cycle sensor histidine kinase/response regulator CckA
MIVPAAVAHSSTRPATPLRPDIADHPACILIVDDERRNRRLLELLLTSEGYLLYTAGSGEAALALVAEHPPDLILLDVMMPGMDGYEVVTTVKANPTTNTIPIILVTALDDRNARVRGLSAGAEDFLSKPVDRAELCARVKNLLRLKAYGDYYDKYSQFLECEVRSRTAELLQSHRLSELAVRHERDQAQRYLDTAAVILLALDLQGQVTLVNDYACALLGWTAAELRGRDWVETCVPVPIRDALREERQNLIGGDLSVTENAILTRSGGERLIEWRNTVIRDDAGHVTGTFSCGTDITARNQAAEALRTAEERMRFALETANVGIWDMDCATGMIKWSETLEAQHGLQPGMFGGTFEAFVERIHPDDRESVRETVEKAMTSGQDFSFQNRSIWPDGTVRRLSGAGRILLGEDGNSVRGVGISLDVTERRTLEDQFQQAQKMEAVGRLAGGVAHDFNNLLTVILGFCELLLIDGDPDDPRQADIAEIQKAGTSGAGLTRQLLSFSRKQIIAPSLLNLNVVVTDMRAMLGRLIGEDVKIVVSLRQDLALVTADRGQIEQIVMNLAVNARDAMPTGGTLTIETANVELDHDYAQTHLAIKPGPYVGLTVTDTGTGMTPEVQARLFEPFFTTKEPGKGTGLGMATVYGIVMRAGGSVGVYSEVGKGTAFKVYFPQTNAEEMIIETPVPLAAPHAGTQTVLVVDDEDGLRELAKRLLQRHGYTVLVAANANEALQRFDEKPSVDVLLTDVVMPGASGPELARQLIARRPALRVIYMSGYTEEAVVQQGVVTPPGLAFLHKPFTAAALVETIREVVER